MLNNSLVTIIIPTFNRCRVLKRAILSATGQTYENIEILVINDGSSDATPEIVNSIDDRRIKYFSNKESRGPAAARNTGIKNASGDFITFLEDDDEWLAEKISKQLGIYQAAHTEVGLVFTNGFSEYENGYIIREKIDSGIIYNPEQDKFFPLRILISPPSSWMLPAIIVRKIGYFDESMYNWDDGDYLVRVAHNYPLYFLNENLLTWHALQPHVNAISPNLIKGKEIFLRKNLEALKQDPEYLFRFYRTLGKDLLLSNKKRARSYLLKALKMNPIDSSTISKIIKTFLKDKADA